MTKIVTIGLGTRAYAIHVGAGLMEQAGSQIRPFARGPVPVVTDDVVAEIHLAGFLDRLGKAGLDARPIIVPAGEASKSFSRPGEICAAELPDARGVERGSLIVVLGGGVVGDLTGFAAGVLKARRRLCPGASSPPCWRKWICPSAAKP